MGGVVGRNWGKHTARGERTRETRIESEKRHRDEQRSAIVADERYRHVGLLLFQSWKVVAVCYSLNLPAV